MRNRRQHGNPLLISGFDEQPVTNSLERIELADKEEERHKYNERWLQELLFNNPGVLPVEEIEPAFIPLHPVCIELPTKAGNLDNLYVSENGGLTLVECKLWRNPQARREVVGQIIDYAKEFSNWSYEDLEEAICKVVKNQKSLYEIVSEHADGIDEAIFIDAVSRNLKRGRFLLLIIGDGIREGVENIINFLQVHTGLNFTFGLIELAMYLLPESNDILVLPRTITQTYSVERAVITVESESIKVSQPVDLKITHKQTGKRTNISEEQFYENLEKSVPGISKELKGFIDELSDLDIFPTPGEKSLNIHWNPEGRYTINFASIKINGNVNTEPTNWALKDTIHKLELAFDYFSDLCEIVPDSHIRELPSGNGKVVVGEKSEFSIQMLLSDKAAWVKAIRSLQDKIIEVIR